MKRATTMVTHRAGGGVCRAQNERQEPLSREFGLSGEGQGIRELGVDVTTQKFLKSRAAAGGFGKKFR